LLVRGPSGSGKSTLLALLMAALRPRTGEYRLAQTLTATLSGVDIRRPIAWCPQDAHVFASTIRANLCLGLPSGSTDVDGLLWTVLERVGLADLVASLPDGLDTYVGSGAARLSGGERRRLAVARTLLTDRDVILLDEPTAHLDPAAARALLADLRRGLRDRTVVCVTHDPFVEAPGDTVLDLGPQQPPGPLVGVGEVSVAVR
jgi:ATP-binding cassette subfamily C protein CydCD